MLKTDTKDSPDQRRPITELPEGIGEAESQDGHTTMALDDPTQVWFVNSGQLEIFGSIQSTDGEPSPRRHLFTLDEGAVVMGLPLQNSSVQVFAVGRLGAEVIPLKLEEFATIAQDPSDYSVGAMAIDQWVQGLSQGATRYISPQPRPTDLIEAGREHLLSGDMVLGTHRTIVWTKLPEECGIYADTIPAPLAGSSVLPLTNASWVRTQASFTAQGRSTETLLADGDWLKSQSSFHDLIVKCLKVTLDLAEMDEVSRLDARERRREAEIARVVDDMASLVGAGDPDVLQAEAGDHLYIAAAAVIKSVGGIPRRPVKIRQDEIDVPPTLEEIAHASGVRYRQIRLSGAWWKEDMGPLLAYRGEDKLPIALIPNMRGGYEIQDPDTGNAWSLDEKTATSIQDHVHILFKELPSKKVSIWSTVLFGMEQSGWDISSAFLAAFLGALLGLALPTAATLIFNNILPGHLTGLLLQVGLALIVIALLGAAFKVILGVSMLRISSRTNQRLKAAIWDRLLRMPSHFLQRYAAGDLANRASGIEGFQFSMRQTAQTITVSGVMAVFSLALLFWFDWRAALVAGTLLVALIGVTILFGIMQYRAFKGGEHAAGLVDAYILEILSGISKIRLAGAEERAFVNWADRFTLLRGKIIRARHVTNIHSGVMAAYRVMSLAGLFAVIALMNENPISTGAFVGFMAAYANATLAAQQISQSIIGISYQIPLMQYTRPVLESAPISTTKKTSPGQLTGGIEINNVYFRYSPDTPPVLSGLNLAVSPGEFVAVVGLSGSGKSTLARLLLGLEQPQAGGVFYDGRDLRGLDIDAVRRQIGTVLQHPKLMPGTLLENIRGVNDTTEEDAWKAVELAGVADDIRAMPMAMQTLVAGSDSTFAGGQIQRLAIARATIHRPPILIFDEATSALDNKTQTHVTDGLKKLSATRIVIAHRLSTIRDADRILVMDQGRFVESGSYVELMAKDGLFARMAERQLL